MKPSVPHAPPKEIDVGAIGTGEPPAIATFFRPIGSKNPIHFPSGEKKGPPAVSVPGSSVESFRSMECSRSFDVAPARTRYAIFEPSGEIANPAEFPPSATRRSPLGRLK